MVNELPVPNGDVGIDTKFSPWLTGVSNSLDDAFESNESLIG